MKWAMLCRDKKIPSDILLEIAVVRKILSIWQINFRWLWWGTRTFRNKRKVNIKNKWIRISKMMLHHTSLKLSKKTCRTIILCFKAKHHVIINLQAYSTKRCAWIQQFFQIFLQHSFCNTHWIVFQWSIPCLHSFEWIAICA